MEVKWGFPVRNLALKKISAYSSNDYIKSIKYYIREGVFIFREGENKLCEGEITAYYRDGIRYE